MIRCSDDLKMLEKTRLENWIPYFQKGLETRLAQYEHGQLHKWQKLLNALPDISPSVVNLSDTVKIGQKEDLNAEQHQMISDIIEEFHPWRKGPFALFGHEIDCEWRSDWKWQRIVPHISPLKNRHVLDIGCGNGYHLWRMAAEKAKRVIGIDPSQLFWAQFQLFKHYLPQYPLHLLPIGIEHLPAQMISHGFDSIFCMGVLYHRRSPIDFLIHLKSLLRKGGELILETLVIEGDENQVLVPEDRYAQMRNVWFIPSAPALEKWLARTGFKNIELIDVNQTSPDEQRQTKNMTYQSLSDFLDPENNQLTIEGYPAPKRATLIATT